MFPSISLLESNYRHSHLPNNGSTTAVAYAAVTPVAAIVNATGQMDRYVRYYMEWYLYCVKTAILRDILTHR